MSEHLEIYDKESLKEFSNICGINYTQKILSGKWKISIIWYLKEKPKRFGEIQKFLSNLYKGSITR